LRCREEVRDFGRRGLGRVAAVHRVGVDRLREIGADRALGGFLRIGGAHEVAVLRDGALAFEHLDHHRARDHEIHEVVEERAPLVHRVETFRVASRQARHARGHDLESRLFESCVDLADHVPCDCVRLDDRQGPFHRHKIPSKSSLN
jgi:hypothetical protein